MLNEFSLFFFDFFRRRRPWTNKQFVDAWNKRHPKYRMEYDDVEEDEPEVEPGHAFKRSPAHEPGAFEAAGEAVSATDEVAEPDWVAAEDPCDWLGTGYARHVVEAYVRDRTVMPSEGAVLSQASRMIPSDEAIRSRVTKERLVSDKEAEDYMAQNPNCQVMVVAKREVYKRRLIAEKKEQATAFLLAENHERAQVEAVEELISYRNQYGRSQVLVWHNEANKPASFEPVLVSNYFFCIIC